MNNLEFVYDEREFEQMLIDLIAREPDLVIKATEDFNVVGVEGTNKSRALFHYLFEIAESTTGHTNNQIVLSVRNPEKRLAALSAFQNNFRNVGHGPFSNDSPLHHSLGMSSVMEPTRVKNIYRTFIPASHAACNLAAATRAKARFKVLRLAG